MLVSDRQRSYGLKEVDEGPPKIAVTRSRMAGAVSWGDSAFGPMLLEFIGQNESDTVESAVAGIFARHAEMLSDRRDEVVKATFGSGFTEIREILANAQQGSVAQNPVSETKQRTLPIAIAFAGWSTEQKRFRVYQIDSTGAFGERIA